MSITNLIYVNNLSSIHIDMYYYIFYHNILRKEVRKRYNDLFLVQNKCKRPIIRKYRCPWNFSLLRYLFYLAHTIMCQCIFNSTIVTDGKARCVYMDKKWTWAVATKCVSSGNQNIPSYSNTCLRMFITLFNFLINSKSLNTCRHPEL